MTNKKALPRAKAISVSHLDLVDSRGNVRAQLTVDNAGTPMLLLFDTKGKRRLQASALEHSFEGEPTISLYAPDGETILTEISEDGIQQPEKRTEQRRQTEGKGDTHKPAKTYKDVLRAIPTRRLSFEDDAPIYELVDRITDDENADHLLLLLNLIYECDNHREHPAKEDHAGWNVASITFAAIKAAIGQSSNAIDSHIKALVKQTEGASR
jgi:hypothetical protein